MQGGRLSLGAVRRKTPTWRLVEVKHEQKGGNVCSLGAGACVLTGGGGGLGFCFVLGDYFCFVLTVAFRLLMQ